MTLIELFAPKGALSADKQQYLSQRLVTELMRGEGMPPDLAERVRMLGWLVIHEPAVWTIGGHSADMTAPPYLVRVSVPGGHLNDAMRAEMITRLTQVLAEADDAPQTLYQTPRAWVQILELSDGNIGAFGQPLSTVEIIKLVVDPTHKIAEPPNNAMESAIATTVDPICGMTVLLTPDALTWTTSGTIYGFCCQACHDLFVSQHPTT